MLQHHNAPIGYNRKDWRAEEAARALREQRFKITMADPNVKLVASDIAGPAPGIHTLIAAYKFLKNL